MNHLPVPDSQVWRHLQLFVESRRAKGRIFDQEERVLRMFQRDLRARGVLRLSQVTPKVVRAFLRRHSFRKNDSFNQLLYVLEGAFNWLVVHEYIKVSPVDVKHRKSLGRRTPYIFSDDESRELVRVAGALPTTGQLPYRGEMYGTLFAMLRGLGLRLSEAARARIEDVDLDLSVFTVRDSKFGKDRIVPFGPQMRRRLAAYLGLRVSVVTKPSDYLFSFDGRRPISKSSIHRRFGEMLGALGLLTARSRPRPHDLRHSFAVAAILHWYRVGANVAEMLEWLSIFLGHTTVEATSVYMTVTAEIRRLASSRFERLSSGALPR